MNHVSPIFIVCFILKCCCKVKQHFTNIILLYVLSHNHRFSFSYYYIHVYILPFTFVDYYPAIKQTFDIFLLYKISSTLCYDLHNALCEANTQTFIKIYLFVFSYLIIFLTYVFTLEYFPNYTILYPLVMNSHELILRMKKRHNGLYIIIDTFTLYV